MFTNFDAKVIPGDPDPSSSPLHDSWFVSHGLGTPAKGLYTEFWIRQDYDTAMVKPEHISEVVRQVANQLYGNRWAFIYPPDQFEDSIRRYGMRRRERVLITGIEVIEP